MPTRKKASTAADDNQPTAQVQTAQSVPQGVLPMAQITPAMVDAILADKRIEGAIIDKVLKTLKSEEAQAALVQTSIATLGSEAGKAIILNTASDAIERTIYSDEGFSTLMNRAKQYEKDNRSFLESTWVKIGVATVVVAGITYTVYKLYNKAAKLERTVLVNSNAISDLASVSDPSFVPAKH